jgi:hypothetical protein
MNAFQFKTMHTASSLRSLVTASAATTTTAAVATAAASTSSAATATAATTILAWASFVHSERTAVVLRTIHARDGRLRFFVRAHFDKAETFASARVAIHDDFGTLHGAVLTKDLVQI